MIEVREVLRVWLAGYGLRRTAELAAVDCKTVRRYVEAAQAAGLTQESAPEAVDDLLVGAVVSACRPGRPGGFGTAWESLCAREEQIGVWVRDGLTTVKIGDLLAREGSAVPYWTLARFVAERCEGGRAGVTVRVDDGEPGAECQLDFGRMGLVPDPDAGRRRVAHALILTAVYSRHMFVYFSFSQTLEAVIAGCEEAWSFFGGIFRVLIPDNLSPVVATADPVNPRFTVGWLDYAQARGFLTDPARVATPTDKPRVERTVTYVRKSLFAGEAFLDLADAQARARHWCATTAGKLRTDHRRRVLPPPATSHRDWEQDVRTPRPARRQRRPIVRAARATWAWLARLLPAPTHRRRLRPRSARRRAPSRPTVPGPRCCPAPPTRPPGAPGRHHTGGRCVTRRTRTTSQSSAIPVPQPVPTNPSSHRRVTDTAATNHEPKGPP